MDAINMLGVQAGSGIAGEAAKELGWGLGEISGYNQAQANRQLEQQSKLNKQQQQLNWQTMDKQQQLQKDMINYTDASHQVQRIRDAGLSVGLMYGGSAAGGQTTTGNASAIGVNGGNASSESDRNAAAMQNVAMGLQLQKLESEIKVNESIANNNNAKVDNLAADTGVKLETTELLKEQTTNTQLKNEYQEYDNIVKQIESEIAKDTKEDIVSTVTANLCKLDNEARQISNNADITEQSKKSLIGINNQNWKNTILQGIEIKTKINLNEATKNKIGQEILNLKEQIEMMESEINRNDIENKTDKFKALTERFNANTNRFNARINSLLGQAGIDNENAKIYASMANSMISGATTLMGAKMVSGGLKQSVTTTVTRPVYDTQSGQVVNRTFTSTEKR